MTKTKYKLLGLSVGLFMLLAVFISMFFTANAQTAFAAELCQHEYESIVVEPTCTSKGYTTYFCKECGNKYYDDYVTELGHDYVSETISPTCTEDGYTKHTCKNCGDEYIDAVVEAIGHSYKETVVIATCDSYGYTEHLCENCNDRYVTDYVKPYGHRFGKTVVEATADSTGYTKYVCSDCNFSYLTDFVTSGDNGYVELPTEPEKPTEPTEPTEPENPDQPTNPDEHIHDFTLFTEINQDDKYLTVDYSCECGEKNNDVLRIMFESADGEGVTFAVNEYGQVDFSNLTDGSYQVTVADLDGEVLTSIDILVGEKTPDVPDEPITPDEPSEPTTPDEPTEPTEPTEPEAFDNGEQKEESKTFPVTLILFIVLIVLAIGGAVTYIIIKKKKSNKNKEIK